MELNFDKNKFYYLVLEHGRKVRITFMIGDHKAFSFDLHNFESIKNLIIHDKVFTEVVLGNNSPNLTSESLCELFREYLLPYPSLDLHGYIKIAYEAGIYSASNPRVNIRIDAIPGEYHLSYYKWVQEYAQNRDPAPENDRIRLIRILSSTLQLLAAEELYELEQRKAWLEKELYKLQH